MIYCFVVVVVVVVVVLILIDDNKYLTSILTQYLYNIYTVNHRTKLTKKSVLNESVSALSLMEMFEYQFFPVDTNWKL